VQINCSGSASEPVSCGRIAYWRRGWALTKLSPEWKAVTTLEVVNMAVRLHLQYQVDSAVWRGVGHGVLDRGGRTIGAGLRQGGRGGPVP
jgi:hypothetical protein